jgi:hypothetical protein
MHRQAQAELVRYNPDTFLAPGQKRTWWHRLIGKREYPAELVCHCGRALRRDRCLRHGSPDGESTV